MNVVINELSLNKISRYIRNRIGIVQGIIRRQVKPGACSRKATAEDVQAKAYRHNAEATAQLQAMRFSR